MIRTVLRQLDRVGHAIELIAEQADTSGLAQDVGTASHRDAHVGGD